MPINARRKLKKVRQQMMSISQICNEVWQDLRAAGLEVNSIQDVPEAVKALIELARDGQSSNLEIVVEQTTVEFSVPGQLTPYGVALASLSPIEGDEGMPMLEEVEFGLDGMPIDPAYVHVQAQQQSASQGNPNFVPPKDFAKAANDKMKARLAHVAEHGVSYRPVGLGGLKTQAGLIPDGVPKPTIEEQKAALEAQKQARRGGVAAAPPQVLAPGQARSIVARLRPQALQPGPTRR